MASYQPSDQQQPKIARKRLAYDNVHAKIDGLMAQAADATIANFLEWNDYTLHRSHHIVTYNDDKVPKISGDHNEEWDDDTSASSSSSPSSRSVYSSPTILSKKRRTAQHYPREPRNPYYVPSGKRRIIATRAA